MVPKVNKKGVVKKIAVLWGWWNNIQKKIMITLQDATVK